jgi:hypothetical protein
VDYQDQVTLVLTTPDEYGTPLIADTHLTPATVILGGIGTMFTNNEDVVTADITIFVDPSDAWVQSNHYRLEEMLVVAPLFDTPQAEAWYKVKDTKVSRDVLLSNQIETVRLSLKKTSSIGYVS